MAREQKDINKKSDEHTEDITDDSSINHINRLIGDSDNDEYFIEENDTVIQPADAAAKDNIMDEDNNPEIISGQENSDIKKINKEKKIIKKDERSEELAKHKGKASQYFNAEADARRKDRVSQGDGLSSKNVLGSVKSENSYKSAGKSNTKKDTTSAEKETYNKAKMVNNHNNILKHSPKRAIIIKAKKSEKVEMAQKKNKQKILHDHTKKHRKVLPWVVFIIIVIAAVIMGLIFINRQAATLNKDVAATVNGAPIKVSDIDAQYESINPLMRQMYTKEFILNQSINELLLLQESEKRSILVDDAMISSEIEAFKEQNGLDDKDLELILVKQNMTLSELKDIVKKKLAVRQLLNQSVLKDISITDAQANDYYVNNIDKFQEPEKVKVSHILVMTSPNMTEDVAQQKILSINKSLNKDNFCQLVTEYSDDTGSKASCGIYTFTRGEMVPEFEEASFSLSTGKTAIVQSMYGYHLIKKLEHYPAQVLNFSDVKEEIVQILSDTQAQEKFDAFMVQIREKAVIVINKDALKDDAKAESSLLESMPTTITQSNEAEIEETALTVQPTEDKPLATETKSTVSSEPKTEGSDLDDFAKCLTEEGAKLYAASWCPHCRNQKAMFGESVKYITYVECAVEGNPQIQTEECSKAGITGYPTWIINGKSYPGEQELKDLSRLTGCGLD